jgi:hypothetical protein
MKDVNVPFSLYDFFAILFPGLFGVASIYLFIDPSLKNINLYFSNLNAVNDFLLIIIFVITCYFIGHIFNVLGNFFVERPATNFIGWTVNVYLAKNGILQDKGIRGFVRKDGRLKFPKRVFEYVGKSRSKPVGELIQSCIEVTFGKVNQDYGYVYRLIYAYVTQFAPVIAGEAKVFTATAAMYESLTVAFVLMGIALLKGNLQGQIATNPTIGGLIVLVLLSILCFSSSRRYKRMWVETIYAAFVAVVKSQKPSKQSPNKSHSRLPRGEDAKTAQA